MGDTDINTLNKKIGVKCNLLKEPMFLTSTNRKASEINAVRMKNIREEEKIYKIQITVMTAADLFWKVIPRLWPLADVLAAHHWL